MSARKAWSRKTAVAGALLILACAGMLGYVNSRPKTNVREVAYQTQCRNNLVHVADGLQTHHAWERYFPKAVVPGPSLRVE
jgi:hypothetical protein